MSSAKIVCNASMLESQTLQIKAFLRLIFTSVLISILVIIIMQSNGHKMKRVNNLGTKKQKDAARGASTFYSDVVADGTHETRRVDRVNISKGYDDISPVPSTPYSYSLIPGTTYTVPSNHVGSNLTLDENEYYRRRDVRVNEYKHRIILGPSRQPICLNDTFMIVLVHSHPSYRGKRQAIRQTWGRPIQAPQQVTWPRYPSCCSGIRLFFVVGVDGQFEAAIRDEQTQSDDIIQGDFIDSYRNLTLKSLFGLKIVAEMCPNVKYLMKSDDDMFINLPFMIERLGELQLKRSIMGPLINFSDVKMTGKWAMTDNEFPFPKFPPYLAGSAYVITTDIVVELLVTSDYVPYIFIDDVYVTGILGRILNVTLVDGKTRFEFARVWSRAASACAIMSRHVMTSTRMTPKKLSEIWNRLHKLDIGKRKRSRNCR